MVRARCAAPSVCAALIVSATTVLTHGCGGSSLPSPGPPSGPGVITVRGAERLAWNQVGDVSTLRFRAYVDDGGVSLDAAVCDDATPEAHCSSPLPSLTDGTHTIALTAVSTFSELESERSVPITVQKVSSSTASRIDALPDDTSSPGALRLEALVVASDRLVFAADIVARGLKAPVQVAPAPDGRLFVAEANGRVRVVHPGEPGPAELALDARTFLDPSLAGSLGLALHPEFARNHFVYLSFLAHDPLDQPLLRIVRLREVGDRLGEPAVLFEAQLDAALDSGGPRLAFGPDGLLYVALPPGVKFDGEPAASAPIAAMMRLSDEGRVPDGMRPLTGVVAHPLGFGWHPSTRALWVIVPEAAGKAVLQPLTAGRSSRTGESERVTLRMTEGAGRMSRSLVFLAGDANPIEWAQALATGLEQDSLRPVRLSVPILAGNLLAGWSGRIGDVVASDGGALFLAMSSSDETPDAGVSAGAGDELIVRLVPRRR